MCRKQQGANRIIGDAQRRYNGSRVLDRTATKKTIRKKDTQHFNRSQRKDRTKQIVEVNQWLVKWQATYSNTIQNRTALKIQAVQKRKLCDKKTTGKGKNKI